MSETSSTPEFAKEFVANYQNDSPDFESPPTGTPEFDNPEDAYSSGASNPWTPSNIFHIFDVDDRPAIEYEGDYRDPDKRFTYTDYQYLPKEVTLKDGRTVKIKVVNRQIYETKEGARGRNVKKRTVSGSTRIEITDPGNPNNKVVIDANPRLDTVEPDAAQSYENRRKREQRKLEKAEEYIDRNQASDDPATKKQVEQLREKLKDQQRRTYEARTQGKRNVLTAEIGDDTDKEFVLAVIDHLDNQTPEMGKREIEEGGEDKTVPHPEESFSEQEEVADTIKFLLEAAQKNKYETPEEPGPGEPDEPEAPDETREPDESGAEDSSEGDSREGIHERIIARIEELTRELDNLREKAQEIRDRIGENMRQITYLGERNDHFRNEIEDAQDLRAFVEAHNPREVLRRYVEVGNYYRSPDDYRTDAQAIWTFLPVEGEDYYDYDDRPLNELINLVSKEENRQRKKLDSLIDNEDGDTPGVTKEGLDEFKQRVVNREDVDSVAKDIFGAEWRKKQKENFDELVISYGRQIQMGVILREMNTIVNSDHIEHTAADLTLNQALEQIRDLPTPEALREEISQMEKNIEANEREIERLEKENSGLEEELNKVNQEIRNKERNLRVWTEAEYAMSGTEEDESRGSAEDESEETPEHRELRDMSTEELIEHLTGLRERIDHLERALVLMDAEGAAAAIEADPEDFGLEDGIPEEGIEITDLIDALSGLDEEDIPEGIDLEQFIQILNEILEDNENARFFPEDDDSDPDNNIRIIINRMIEDNLETLNDGAEDDEVITDPREDRDSAREEIVEEISRTGDEISEAEEILEERGDQVRSAEEQEANRQAAEQSVNELGGLLEQESEEPGFWKNLARNVAEVLVSFGGSMIGRVIAGAAITAGITLAGVTVAPMVVAIGVGALGGAISGGAINTFIRYGVFHKEPHKVFTENLGKGKFTPAKDAINRKLIKRYNLSERLGTLAQAQEMLGQLSAEDANQVRLEDLDMTEEQLTQAFQQLLMIRQLTNYRGLEDVELPEGLQLEGESVEDTLQRMGDVVMRIIGTHNIDVSEVAESVQQEAQDLKKESLWKDILVVNALKGAVIGGISGAVFHAIGNLIGGGASAAEGAGRGAEAAQDVDISQMADTIGDQQVNTIQQWAADQGIALSDTQAEQIFERAAGADGVITGDEVGTLESALNELGINLGDVTGGAEGWTMPRSGFWSYQNINDNFTPDRVQAAGFRWDDTASNHGLFLGNSGEALKNVNVLDQLREAGIPQQDITPEAFAHVYHGGSVEDAVAMVGGHGATAVDTSSLLGELRTMGDVYREAVKGAEQLTNTDTTLGGQTLRSAAQTVRNLATALGIGGLATGTALHAIPAPDFEQPGGPNGDGDGTPGSGGPGSDDDGDGTRRDEGDTTGEESGTGGTDSDERGSAEDGGRGRSEESSTEGTTAEETREDEEESDEPTILLHIGPNGEIFTGPLPNEIEGSRLEDYTTIEINPPSLRSYHPLAVVRENEIHIEEWIEMQQREWIEIARRVLDNQDLRVTDMIQAQRGDNERLHVGSVDPETRRRNAERLKELVEENLNERVETLQRGVSEQLLSRLEEINIDNDTPLAIRIRAAKRAMDRRFLSRSRCAPSVTMDYLRTMDILLDEDLDEAEKEQKVRDEIWRSAQERYQKVRGFGIAGLSAGVARDLAGQHPPGLTYIVTDLAYQSLGLDRPDFLSDLSLPESEPETRPGLNLEQIFRTVGHLEISSLDLEDNVINRLVNFLLVNNHLDQAEAIFIVTGLDEDDVSRLTTGGTRRTTSRRRGRRPRSGVGEADETTTSTEGEDTPDAETPEPEDTEGEEG